MTRAVVRSEVQIAAPARTVWAYVTDWPRQGEWIPFTRVEAAPDPRCSDGAAARAEGVGDRIRAWTGVGPAGFWDPMTITSWETDVDGSARCEVLHTGRVVRGDGMLAVVAQGPTRCTFVWSERLDIPGGMVGGLLWRLTGWAFSRGIDLTLRRLAHRVEHTTAHG